MILNNYKDFLIREVHDLDYSSYQKELNKDEFVHVLRTDCSEWDPKRIRLSRSLHLPKTKPPLIKIIDASKHETRFPQGRYHNYILYHVIDKSRTWGEIPNKYKSLDFWYSLNPGGIPGMSVQYALIPFNNAKMVNAEELIGRYMPFVKKVFHLQPVSLCVILDRIYKETFGQDVDYTNSDTTISCLRKLNEPIMNSKNVDASTNPFYNVGPFYTKKSTESLLYSFKITMEKHQKEDIVEFLDYCFGPKKNNFKLVDKDFCYSDKISTVSTNLGDNYQPGWTDSKVLMVEINLFKQMLPTL